MLDNRYALVFIRGELPVMDEKYDILKHPNINLTADGKGRKYRHGDVRDDVASIVLEKTPGSICTEPELRDTNYVLLFCEDLIDI